MQLRQQRGFTLAELSIAMAIFSLVLLVMAAGVLQLYHIYEAGHQIRDTQEAARTITQDITDDTHNSLMVAVGTAPDGQNTICLYKTIQQLGGTSALVGVEYYTQLHTGSTNLYDVHRADVTTPYVPPALPGCNGSLTADNILNSAAVTVSIFQASDTPAANPLLISLAMSVESTYQLPADTQVVNGLDQCVGGAGSQYCSITNIQMSALSHGGSGS